METKPKIIVVVGPNASGKSSLGIKVAKKFDGEIISADSRQVYRGLDLGTGKVTKEEMRGIPHHLLDIADPMETYTAADFIQDGRGAIVEILSRKKLPIIVGGTFFYIDALLGKIDAPEVPPNPELRAKLEVMGTDALYTVLLQNDERRAFDIDPHNKRRIIRALEIVEALGNVPPQDPKLFYNTLTIGIQLKATELRKNIHERLHKRVGEGMIEEVQQLLKDGVTEERMEELGLEYRYVARYVTGKIKKEATLRELEAKIRQFAKRQMTWLKRDKTIKWFRPDNTSQVFNAVRDFLQ